MIKQLNFVLQSDASKKIQDQGVLNVDSAQAIEFLQNIVKQNSIQIVSGSIESSFLINQNDQSKSLIEFFKLVFQCLKENGNLNLQIIDFQNYSIDDESIKSYAKLVGFQNLNLTKKERDLYLQAEKYFSNENEQSNQPAKIKRKQKQVEQSNPWENLDNQNSTLINEEDLLIGEQVQVKTYCGDKDVMQGAKPCANCSCGLKEKYDALNGDKKIENLENGNTESSCGKCYMGDAFRCASCPYKGLPAFEKGDKVKLITNNTDALKVIQDQSCVVSQDKKVMLNTDEIDF